ncbi:hypothetical protein H7849_04300 [Alloacidobacterium dinghuense]|uniref:DUF4397 domain-containing protein n=1 Tax=Alloacidobacterium dinghuense TaxID=2763107 RepID=A0A7G8BKX9_9BACT|nr:hypothetical protein [Alloacidobacterium dinghuense]QNI33199.1 hypothetical protein H7849_04300 [Alloacidobacterium dinghuense]
MRLILKPLIVSLIALATQLAIAESSNLGLPKTVEAGKAFSIQSKGSGVAVLYFVGPDQVLRRDVQLGGTTSIPAGTLYNAGHYTVILVGASSTDSVAFDVVPTGQPAALSFLAKPSRLPVGLHNGLSGAVYVFDSYQNLITAPIPVSFELSNASGFEQTHTVTSRDGAAWITLDSTPKEGAATFMARAGGTSSARVIEQVPGEPCGLRITARQLSQKLDLQTDPVRDCSGNVVPDGTIVTFTETYNGTQSTADVPLKRGIARVEMPAYDGARISVASGVVMGNEIRWGR